MSPAPASLVPATPALAAPRLLRMRALSLAVLAVGCAAKPAPPAAAPPKGAAPTCLPLGPETCYDATDDNCNGMIDEGCGTVTGLVHIAISWREPEADVDLDVIDPEGELVELTRPRENGLVKLRDCPGEEEACRGSNSEHVLLEADHALPLGTYRVRVRLEKLRSAEPPIRVSVAGRLGPKHFQSEVLLERESAEQELVWEL